MTHTWTESTTYDALSLWEEILENLENYPCVEKYREEYGSGQTREDIMGWVRPLNEVFDVAYNHGWVGAFDFDFIPQFLKYCTNAAAPDDHQLKLTITPEDYSPMGQYLALLKRAEGLTSLITQSIRKTNGSGPGPAYSPDEIRQRVTL